VRLQLGMTPGIIIAMINANSTRMQDLFHHLRQLQEFRHHYHRRDFPTYYSLQFIRGERIYSHRARVPDTTVDHIRIIPNKIVRYEYFRIRGVHLHRSTIFDNFLVNFITLAIIKHFIIISIMQSGLDS